VTKWDNGPLEVLLHTWKQRRVRLELLPWLRPGAEVAHALRYSLARAIRAREATPEVLALLAVQQDLELRTFLNGYGYAFPLDDYLGLSGEELARDMLRAEVLYARNLLEIQHLQPSERSTREIGQALARVVRHLEGAPAGTLRALLRDHTVGRVLGVVSSRGHPVVLEEFLPAGRDALLSEALRVPLYAARTVLIFGDPAHEALVRSLTYTPEDLREIAAASRRMLDEIEGRYQGEVPGAADRLDALADRLAGHAKVRAVRYPGRADHPQHPLHARQMSAGGTLIAISLGGGRETAFAFLNGLRLIDISNNLGDAKSLACQPASTTHRTLSDAERAEIGLDESWVRVSVGLEDVRDLEADLIGALDGL